MADFVKYDIPEKRRGTTWKGLAFQIILNGSPVNLTNATIKCQFRQSTKTGTVVKEVTIGSGITLTDAVLGKFKIDGFVVDFKPGTYYYDVKYTIDALPEIYVGGLWPITQNVTE